MGVATMETQKEPASAMQQIHNVYEELEPEAQKIEKAASKDQSGTKRKAESDKTDRKRKKRFIWNNELHQYFMATIFDIGLRLSKPKTIMEELSKRKHPEGMTSEHVKSHLQKYRNNCKKARELFYSQFEIASEHAQQSSDGKVLNPRFHAYPIPMNGANAMPAMPELGITPSAPTVVHVQHGPQMGVHPSYCHSCCSHGQHYSGAPHHCHQMLYSLPFHPTRAGGCGTRPGAIEQMEVQMKIHHQIENQHELQQTKLENDKNKTAATSSSSTSSPKPYSGREYVQQGRQQQSQQTTQQHHEQTQSMDELDMEEDLLAGDFDDNLFDFLK